MGFSRDGSTMLNGYDYIIVGGGSTGCVLAARLSQDPAARVLLLETGGLPAGDRFANPTAWPGLVGSDADWREQTVPQAGAGALPYPRGRVLGGSGSVNAMAHLRGHRSVYDGWAAGGAAGWDYDSLLPYFNRTERRRTGSRAGARGDTGPVEVGPVPPGGRHPVARALVKALAARGYPVTDDLSGTWAGVGFADLAITASCERASPFTAYLQPAMTRPGLEVRTGSMAIGLTIRHGRCTSVTYLHDGGVRIDAASQEVIVCAGAIGTPRLLLLSGIGPADELRTLGISPACDLPGVGENLQDHPVAKATYQATAQLPASRHNHGEAYAVIPGALTEHAPDLQVFPLLRPVAVPGHPVPPSGFALAGAAMTPDSRGTVRLPSASPLAPPLIDPGLLRDERDLDRLEDALSIAREAAQHPAFTRLGCTELAPGPAIQDAGSVRAYIRATVSSYHHPAGTCAMGTSPDTVTDPQLRVHGITGLRVADASVMPVIPNAHPHATVLAIAEKAADMITGSRP
jgi:choline dehydrogenase